MQVETKSRKAFELVTEALLDLDLYKKSKDRTRLDSAQSNLAGAMTADPKYLRALYINAMVSDLQGKPKDAVEQLETVLRENPPFADEVRYNLAVASYHRYSHEHLDKAIKYFAEILENDDLKDNELKLLARAGRAQAYAMHEIPKNPDEPNKDEIKKFFVLSKDDSAKAQEDIEQADVSEELKREVKWTALNARGMALMYFTDFFPESVNENAIAEKIQNLDKAVMNLKKADQYNPKDWANYCDMGSAQMRLGYWRKRKQEENFAAHFEKALEYLEKVVTDLRPNYGFALYEIGRVYRLNNDFNKAREYFMKAFAIDKDYRDVGDARVKKEYDRAAAKSDIYP